MSRDRSMIRVWTVLAVVALATACGGGDSGGPTALPTVPDPSVMQPVVSVEVSSPTEPTALGEPLQLGETLQLSVEALDENGQAVAGVEFSWESSNTSVATVDATGLVTAVAEGTATITASGGDVQATVEITVVSATQPVVSVEVSPSAETIAIGTTLQLSAEAFDENGQAVAGAEFSWESNNTSVATVDASGLVTGVAEGTATITASAGSVQGRAHIAVANPVASSDRGILEAFYHATGGPNWVNSNNWLTDAPLSEWHGVVTDAQGRVTEIYLAFNDLSGSLPPDLGELVALETLDLFWNDLAGPIPPELGKLTSLTTLNLALNELSGPIPADLTGLTSLTTLNLAANELSGPIPADLTGLTSLTTLNLGSNELSGPIPADLTGLTSLTTLNLGANELSGPIPPELTNLTRLEILVLGGNLLTGPIPPELGNLTRLEILDLDASELSGPIPPELGKLTNLTDLDLSTNELSGPIPPELGNLSNLTDLGLGLNSLTGPIPPELGNLTNLTYLFLFYAGVSGPVPPELGNLTRLTSLYLSNNELTGPVPPELGNLTNLEILSLGSNELTGPVPQSFLALDMLTWFFFDHNAGLCAPNTTEFITWLQSIDQVGGPFCSASSSAPR